MGLLDGTSSAPSASAMTGGLGALGALGNPQQKLRTSAEILRAQQMAAALQKTGSDITPIASPWQGAARIADVLAGDMQASQSHDDDIARAKYIQSQFASALGAGGAVTNPMAAALMGKTADASGGDPSAAPQQTADASGTFGRMIGAESGGQQFDGSGNPLTSPKGAIGVAQVMPGTAPEAAQYAGLPFDETRYRTDPAYNAALGQAYYQHQLQTFGDAGMAAAAYNAGPGAVQNAMAAARQNGGSYLDHLPAETQNYVAKVAGSNTAAPADAQAYAPAPGGNSSAPAMAAISGVSPTAQPVLGGGSPSPDASATSSIPSPSASSSLGSAPLPPGVTSPPPMAPAPGAPTQMAANGQGGPVLPNGAFQGASVAQPAPRSGGMNPAALLAIMTNPYASPQEQQMAATLYSAVGVPKPVVSAGDGYLYDPNRGTFVASPGAGHPSVQVTDKFGNVSMVDPYNPGKPAVPVGTQSSQPLTRPMSPQEMKAANLPPDAHVQVNTKTGEISQIPGGAGDDSYSKQLTEGLGKAHAALANNVEENQSQARDLNAMQGALQRIRDNGGTTGGLAAQDILDLKKAVNAGANVIGVSQPFDVSDPEFLTKFNRQIAAAAASTGSNGGRVTNFAIQNMLKANPGLELSPEGNQRLIGIQQQIIQRNVAVGQQIRDATGQAMASGQKVQPADVEKIIRTYDDQNHIQDPITGQDLTKNPTLADLARGGKGTAGPRNPGVGVTPQQDGAPATPKSKQDYDALAHGALYVAPDGSTRRKP